MVQLSAEEHILDQLKLLTRDDIKASTAILDPNIPASSAYRLSWIWKTGSRILGLALDTMRECKL
jgi:hypothetical protein